MNDNYTYALLILATIWVTCAIPLLAGILIVVAPLRHTLNQILVELMRAAEIRRCNEEIARCNADIATDIGALIGAADWTKEKKLLEGER